MPRCRSVPAPVPAHQQWGAAAYQPTNMPACHKSGSLIVRPSTSPMETCFPPPTLPRTDQTMQLEQPSATQVLTRGLSRRGSTSKRPSTSSSGFDGGGRPPRGPLQPLAMGELAGADGVMVVEGTTTGAERFVEATIAREPASNFALRNEKRVDSFRKAEFRRERQLEAEVRRLQGLLNGCNKEISSLRSGISSLQTRLKAGHESAEQTIASLRMRSTEQEDQLAWSDTKHAREKDAWAQQIRELKAKCEAAEAEAASRRNDMQSDMINLQSATTSLQQENRDLTAQAAEFKRKAEAIAAELAERQGNDAEVSSLRTQTKSREAMITQVKAALAEEASSREKYRIELKESRDDLIMKEASMMEMRGKTDQLIQYVAKICQPHFAVVKDESLTPVNVSGFQVTEGHVLVPLILLLEGYALLPANLKSVIDVKSSRLQNGIDYSVKSKDSELSYRNRLFSMMEEKQTSSGGRSRQGRSSSVWCQAPV
ncbi:hypothetical protein DIPPA_25458 [Diplonema papillatum]|nr:hypothetical protein DIPPA_25458 [Diplonema papillatum]